jgi:hypothetical protein
VINLDEATVLDPRGLVVLLRLYDRATASGTEIHITTAQRDEVHRALHITGLDQLFHLDSTVEAVIADVRAGRDERTSTKRTWMMRKAGQGKWSTSGTGKASWRSELAT